MIIWWPPPTSSGGSGPSTNPGAQNVLNGVSYEIDGVQYVGTLIQNVIGNGTGDLDAPDNEATLEAQC